MLNIFVLSQRGMCICLPLSEEGAEEAEQLASRYQEEEAVVVAMECHDEENPARPDSWHSL